MSSPRTFLRTLLPVALSVLLLLTIASPAVHAAEEVSQPRAVQMGFSPGFRVLWESDAELARDLDGMAATGAAWVRFDLDWSQVQHASATSWDWSRFDRLVDGAHARGLQVVAMPAYTPAWARPAGTTNKHDLATRPSSPGSCEPRPSATRPRAWMCGRSGTSPTSPCSGSPSPTRSPTPTCSWPQPRPSGP